VLQFAVPVVPYTLANIWLTDLIGRRSESGEWYCWPLSGVSVAASSVGSAGNVGMH
jgi:hypothetical protein